MSARRATSNDTINVAKSRPASVPARSASFDAIDKPSDGQETVKVVVRMRPFNTKEKNENRGPCVELDYKLRQVSITNKMVEPNPPPNTFTYDSVHGEDTIQIEFYNTACRYLVDSVLRGFNGTIFAYGQTGCGKTWTMQGVLDVPELRGVIPNAFDHIFEHISANPTEKFLVRGSYLEIYNEEVRDLIGKDSKAKLNLKEHPDKGVYVQGLLEEVVSDVDGINEVMARGEKNRTVGATLMNAGSSRSHSIFTCVIEEYGENDSGKDYLRAGKLNLVDLAGSETTSKTGATGARMKEGVNINKSLSALGNVISALVDGGKGKHIPYRDSKLTRLLQSSLGGNTKTLMMAAISPADYNFNETLSTLRYAARAKNIKNKAKVNEDPKDAMLREYMEEIARLKEMLSSVGATTNPDGTITAPATPTSGKSAGFSRFLSADDLDDNDKGQRLSVKEGDMLEVDAQMQAFLDKEGLGAYGQAFVVRGINNIEQLHQPWLTSAEGFLMDKVGMTSLEVSHFQAVMGVTHSRSNTPHKQREHGYSLNHLLDDEEEDEEHMLHHGVGSGVANRNADLGLEDEPTVPDEIVDPGDGDTVTYRDTSTGKVKVMVGTVIARLDEDITLWDGKEEKIIKLMNVTHVVKAPPRTRTPSQDEVAKSAMQELERLKEENAKILAEKTKMEEESLKRREQEDKDLLQRGISFGSLQDESLSGSDALKAQLEAAKEFIRQNEIEEAKQAKAGKGGKGKSIRRGSTRDARGRSLQRYSDEEGEEATNDAVAEGGNDENNAEGSGGPKPVRKSRVISRTGKGVRKATTGEVGEGGPKLKPRIRRPSTDSIGSDGDRGGSPGRALGRYDEGEEGGGEAGSKTPVRAGKGGKGVKPRIRRPSSDSVNESKSDVEDEEAITPVRAGKGGKGVKPRIRRPSSDSVNESKSDVEDEEATTPVRAGKGGKGVKPRIRRPSTDSINTENAADEMFEGGDGVPAVGGNTGKGKGKGVKPVRGRKSRSEDDINPRFRMESQDPDSLFEPETDYAQEGEIAGQTLDSLWDTDVNKVADIQEPPALVHDRECVICHERLLRKTRKHCRACGHSVCELCSDHHIPLPQFGLHEECRCCENCANEIMEANEKAEAKQLKQAKAKNKAMRKIRDEKNEGRGGRRSALSFSDREYDEEKKQVFGDLDGFGEEEYEEEAHRAHTSQYSEIDGLSVKLDISADKLLEPNAPHSQEGDNTVKKSKVSSRKSRDSADLGDLYDDEEEEEEEEVYDVEDGAENVVGRLDKELLSEMKKVGEGLQLARKQQRNAASVKKSLDISEKIAVKAEGGQRQKISDLMMDATTKWESRKKKVAARRKNGKSDSALKQHDGFGEKYRTSSSVLVDDFSGKVVSFDEVLFGGMDPTDHSDLKAGSAVQKKIADLRGLLKKVDALITNAGDLTEYKAKALIQQRETLEIELAQAMEDPEVAERGVRNSISGGVAPLPQAWERGVSLAVLDKFACEVVAPDSSTHDVVQSMRKSLAAVGRRTAFYGLFQDIGLKVVTTRPMRVVMEDGLEYDAEDGTMEEVEMVVPAVGTPNVYISHSWGGSFEDTIMATMSWCLGCGLDPTQVFVWLDCVCLNQWTEVLGALGGVPEQTVVENFIFSIRACGNTLCVASPGFETPAALSRLWCAVEVYISVCVGAQTSFGLPPSEQAKFDELVVADLPALAKRVVHNFDITNAECTSQKDRVMLLKWIKNGHKLWGLPPSRDFAFVNRAVASALRAFLAQTAKRITEEQGIGVVGAIQAVEDESGLTLLTGYADLLEEQGRCGVGSGKGWCFKMAAVWWLKVLRLREHLHGPCAGTAEALLHVAALLKLQGRRDDAALRLGRVVVMLRDYLVGGGGCGHLGNCLVAAARCDIAIVFRDMGRLEDSIKEYRLAQQDLLTPSEEASLTARPDESPDELRSRFELMKTAAHVLGIANRGGDEGLLFEAMLGIASVRVLQGQHDTALTIYNNALTEQEESLGPNHDVTNGTRNCIIALKNRLLLPLHSGEGLSIEGFDRTLKVYEAVFGRTHPHTISVVLQFAALLQRLNESKASLRAYARALSEYAADEILVQAEAEAQQRFMEDGSFGGVSSIDHEATMMVKPQEQEGSSTLLMGDLYDQMSLHQSRDTGGQYSPLDTAACVNNMAVEFRKLGMLGEASESFARALQIKERELGQFHPSTAKIMNNYALVRWRMGHLESALAMFLRLLDLYDALDLTAERIANEGGGPDIDFAAQAAALTPDDPNYIGQDEETERAKRRSGELKFNRETLARGVPPEDVAMTMCHVALVYQQLGKPSDAIDMFGRALAVREEVAFESQVDTLNEGNDGHRPGRSAAAARAAQAAVASTLYNRGLVYHQVNDLLNAGGDLRRAVLASRLSLGPLHEYTGDAAGALAFVSRALAALVVKHARKMIEEKKRNQKVDEEGNPITDQTINDGDPLETDADANAKAAGFTDDFQRAIYEAHKDECISCYESLGDHWRAVKGRGHPAAVAAFNSIAQLHKWEEKSEMVAAAYTRSLREGNSRVDELEDRLRMEASFSADVVQETPEELQANAAIAEMSGRIESLREEKKAAEQRNDIKMEASIKQEILQLQLRIIEQEELGRQLDGGGGRRGSSRASFRESSDDLSLGPGEAVGIIGASPSEKLKREQEARVTETWGSSQILADETRMDEMVVDNWDTPDEDQAALRTRIETLKGLAVVNGEMGHPEESAAYHARVLKLTQRAVQKGGDTWGKQNLVEPLVALAGSAFSLGHFGQSRTLYEQALQVTEKESGPNSPDTAAALNDLAIVVRELHEDQEALQLHARAARIRQKTIGVWNATVAETLFNVSLIYRDLKDLMSAIQVCRGCCRIFQIVLGYEHGDTKEAEGLLLDLNDEYRNEYNSGLAKVSNFFACLTASQPKYMEEVPEELGENPNLRLAFRTLLEEVHEGPQDGYYFHTNLDARNSRDSRGSVGSFAAMMPGGGGERGSVTEGSGRDRQNSFSSVSTTGMNPRGRDSVHGRRSQPYQSENPNPKRASFGGYQGGIAPLSEALVANDNDHMRSWTAGMAADHYMDNASRRNSNAGQHTNTATTGFERRDSFEGDGGGGISFEHD